MKKKMKLTSDIQKEIEEILKDQVEVVRNSTNIVTERTRRKGVKLVKSRSPVSEKKLGKRKRRYSQDWYSKKERNSSLFDNVVIANRQYRLTHLLENGHFVFNQYGGAYRHTNPQGHIGPTQDEIDKIYKEELVKELEKNMK